MTNSEYEAASIAAANASAKFEGEHKLKQCDKAIAVLEESLARKIGILESYKRIYVELSINEEYQLEAYRMLLDCLRNEEADRQMQDEFYQGRL